MMRKGFSLAAGVFGLLVATTPETRAQGNAPQVRVTARPYRTLGMIEPSISLSEPAFIFAVGVDWDGRVTVLSPELPGAALALETSRSFRLPSFFLGFSTAADSYYDGYSPYQYSSFIRNSARSSWGAVLVIASRTPFNFSSITHGANWNEDEIASLIRHRGPADAVYALGRAITSKGQSFGHDYLSPGARSYRLAGSVACYGFGSTFDSPYGFSANGTYTSFSNLSRNGIVLVAPTKTRQGLQMITLGTDGCGHIRYMIVPINVLPPDRPAPADSVNAPPHPIKAALAEPGLYKGEDAIRVFGLIKDLQISDTRPAVREASPEKPGTRGGSPVERMESFDRVRAVNARPTEQVPEVRRFSPPREQPAESPPPMRAEPAARSSAPVPAESRAASGIKDN